MNKKLNDAYFQYVWQMTVHLRNCYGIDEIDEGDVYGAGDCVGFNYCYKLFICFLKAIGLGNQAERFSTAKMLRDNFYKLLKEFEITYSTFSIHYDAGEAEVIDPLDEDYQKELACRLDTLNDKKFKELIADQMTNWTYPSDLFYINEDPCNMTGVLVNSQVIFIEVSKELSDAYSFLLENASPSILSWFIGKKETNETVTYLYLGPCDFYVEYYDYDPDSLEMFNITFFFPLIAYMKRKRKRKNKTSAA